MQLLPVVVFLSSLSSVLSCVSTTPPFISPIDPSADGRFLTSNQREKYNNQSWQRTNKCQRNHISHILTLWKVWKHSFYFVKNCDECQERLHFLLLLPLLIASWTQSTWFPLFSPPSQLPWKSLASVVQFYYMWKTTDRYIQQVGSLSSAEITQCHWVAFWPT